MIAPIASTPEPKIDSEGEQSNFWYVYLLVSRKNGKFYVGCARDLENGLRRHREGESLFAKNEGPSDLVSYEIYSDAFTAQKRVEELRRNPRNMFFVKKKVSNRSMTEKRMIGWSYCLAKRQVKDLFQG